LLVQFCGTQGLASLVLKPMEESDLSPMDISEVILWANMCNATKRQELQRWLW